ncbi:uncharacterized protein FFMR_13619 [Fusarium fujikuroi]
MPEGI